MRILLDTHVLLWLATDDAKLSKEVRTMIGNAETECLFSPVSIAEIALKHKKHPDLVPFDGTEARSVFIRDGLLELSLTSRHAAEADSLELYHSDPFDRMLLAQAKSEGIKIVSHDRQFPQYGDFVIKA